MRALLLLGIGYFLLRKGAQKAPDFVANLFGYSIANIRLVKGESGIFSVKIAADLSLKNKGAVVAKVNSITGDAMAGGVKVGTIVLPQKFSVPAGATISTPIIITASTLDAFKQLLIALQNFQKPRITYKGVIHTNLGGFPFEYTIVG